ncbi:MAG: flagellar export protein FliJ [Pseudomonadota bacterium]
MKQSQTISSLTTLVTLRSTELDRLQTDMAAQTALRERYQANLARLNGLCAASGASGALPLALSVNCGNYKQAVLQLAATHQTDLHLHEATMAVSQRALNAAWAKREVLDQVLTQKQKDATREHQRQDSKRQDELATQLWLRGHFK